MPVSPDDEYLHAAPEEVKGLWSDNLWVSICDREADVFGVNHVHATNKGYARWATMLVIDGMPQPWACRAPLEVSGKFDKLSEGHMSYEVVRPLEELRISFDGPKYGFDLCYRGRFPVFDYRDCEGGNPLSGAGVYGGHYEQGLHCRGEFEVRAGPNKGRRSIDCFAHRDHSWTDRFTHGSPWEMPQPRNRQQSLGHFWPSIQLPDRHINAFGWMNPDFKIPYGEAPSFGGFCSDAEGSRPIRGALCDVRLEADGRTAMSFRYELTLPDGEVIHVKSVYRTRSLGHTFELRRLA